MKWPRGGVVGIFVGRERCTFNCVVIELLFLIFQMHRDKISKEKKKKKKRRRTSGDSDDEEKKEKLKKVFVCLSRSVFLG